jgi:hypothetical protein
MCYQEIDYVKPHAVNIARWPPYMPMPTLLDAPMMVTDRDYAAFAQQQRAQYQQQQHTHNHHHPSHAAHQEYHLPVGLEHVQHLQQHLQQHPVHPSSHHIRLVTATTQPVAAWDRQSPPPHVSSQSAIASAPTSKQPPSSSPSSSSAMSSQAARKVVSATEIVPTIETAAAADDAAVAPPPEKTRKRRRDTSPPPGSAADKKARGRPRIDTKDENAVERRRTQIRLAQRAYRNRKETTLATLEQENDQVRNVNAEMMAAFRQLVSDAAGSNIDPKLAARLDATSKQFMNLASAIDTSAGDSTKAKGKGAGGRKKGAAAAASKDKDTTEDEDYEFVKGGSASGSESVDAPSAKRRAVHSPSPPQYVAASPPSVPAYVVTTTATATTTTMAPYSSSLSPPVMVTADAFRRPSLQALTPPPLTPPGSSWSGDGHNGAYLDSYEVVAAATTENSSLALPMSFRRRGGGGGSSSPPNGYVSYSQSARGSPRVGDGDDDDGEYEHVSRRPSPTRRGASPSSVASSRTKGWSVVPGVENSLATANMNYPVPIAFPGGLYTHLPAPDALSYRESTFGRRLHRTAVQLGLQLLTMMNPPPHLYAAVFGFCLLFESREGITARLTECFQKGTDLSLDNYRVPFVNLGGVGTHFPAHSSGSGKQSPFSEKGEEPDHSIPWGNVGAAQPYQPAHHTGFSTGPFDAKVEEVRDSALGPGMRLRLPGLMGDFFDPEDVELYLRHHGVVIPRGAESIEVEIDADMFSNPDGTTGYAAGAHWQGHTPRIAEMYSQAMTGTLYQPPAADAVAAYVPQHLLAATGKSRVMVNIDVLSYELAFRSVCFGRCPGIRPRDVNIAFWRAATPIRAA